MRRYLLVALWPAGLAAITAATVIVARRAPAAAAPVVKDPAGPDGSLTAGGFTAAGLNGAHPGGVASTAENSPPAGKNGLPFPVPPVLTRSARTVARLARNAGGSADPGAAVPPWLPDLIKLGVIAGAGGVASYGVMTAIGRPVVAYGPAIDGPVYRWTSTHQVRPWAAIMERLNKIGNTWTTWGAAGTAGACLAVTWRRQKWLPPASLGAAILVDHYVTLALRHRFRRVGPPASPLGTYPAGGCDRVVLFYGLIANLLWREFDGSRRGKIWATGAIAGLAFNQAYCREYLSKHWFTDILTGLVYGGVLLAPFAVAVRLIAGPAREQTDSGSQAVAASKETGTFAQVALSSVSLNGMPGGVRE
jgi:hypothetical protein